MIVDALPYLINARPTFDAKEQETLDGFLALNLSASATLSIVNDELVWLFAGPIDPMAVQAKKLPELNSHARERGLFSEFLVTLRAELDRVYKLAEAAVEAL